MDTATQKTTSKDEDRALRPQTFAEYRGQDEVRDNLQVYVTTARKRGEPLDHVLLAGPPGLGKTTLAAILANEMGVRLVEVMGPSVKTKGELSSILACLEHGDILFIDEIHALHPKIAEILYTALEDFKMMITAGNQPITIPVKPFTLVGATTSAGKLLRPLRERFGIQCEMKPYSLETMTEIVKRSAGKLGVACEHDGAVELARRSRGTPRRANTLLRRVRDFAQYAGRAADAAIVALTCDRLGVDAAGLDGVSRRVLQVLVEKGAPVALSTLASTVGEEKDVVEEMVEPYLLSIGFIEKTPKGRVATAAGRAHLRSVG